jgi:hypothetical protein
MPTVQVQSKIPVHTAVISTVVKRIANVLATAKLGNITVWAMIAISASCRQIMPVVRFAKILAITVVITLVQMPIVNVQARESTANIIV